MRIALVGNQNSGKSTLFNVLTGMNQKIGNWPGVTIERKEGIVKDSNHELIDLPGIYSLSPYSEEEKISRDFILKEEISLIINVVDCTSLERSLYLTTQLMELDIPLVLVLNMVDLANKKGIKINKVMLERNLGVKVVEVSALKNIGIDDLKKIMNENHKVNNLKIFDSNIEKHIDILSNKFYKHKRYCSVREIENYTNNDDVIANERYVFIGKVKEGCVSVIQKKDSVTDKLDKLFLNKWMALPIFVFIMFGVYYLSVGVVGTVTNDILDSFIGDIGINLSDYLYTIEASGWLISLIVDGIVTGVSAVLNYVPQLIILFLCISLLETSGYMSRIAFFLDMLFKKFGLSGKTLIPFIVGSGCSVAGIMSTRTIENKSERERSIVLTPFIPCSAKLPIIALFSGSFFKGKTGFVSASLYFLAILLILILAIVFQRFLYKEENISFISELPEYKLPSVKYVIRDVVEKVSGFIKKAGSLILLSSIIVWFLLSFSFRLEYGVEIENSILAGIGKSLSWFFYPILGEFSWGATVSAIQGLVAKEQVVSSMTIIANMSVEVVDEMTLFGRDSVFNFFSGASAYAYVVFNLFSAPCFGAIGAMKKELGSVKKTFLVVLLQISVAWVVSVMVNIIGLLIEG